MIAQLLNRTFLLKHLSAIHKNLHDDIKRAPSGDRETTEQSGDAALSAADLELALETLTLAISRANLQAGGPQDERAFFPRDQVTSMVQSVLQEYIEEKKPEMIRQTDQARAAMASDIAVTDVELIDNAVGAESERGLFEKFSITDLGWANSKIAEGIRLFRGKHAFNPRPAAPVTIANKATVVLFADWATGIPRARNISAAIREIIMKDTTRERHIIHLGDAYYSGWEREYRKRFLPYWPVRENEENKISSWSLNANHDMYSGGYGYFDFLLNDPRFKRQQKSSFFSLENDYWQILGLDTGYDEHDLTGDQAQWVQQRLSSAPRKKGMLLSHHQMFSAYEPGGEKLEQKLQPVLDAGMVQAWFWGHEHRCTLYEPQRKVKYARTIGHGGVPVYADSGSLPAGVQYAYQEALDEGYESWALFGFIVLDFDDDRIGVRYINENGFEHHAETLS